MCEDFIEVSHRNQEVIKGLDKSKTINMNIVEMLVQLDEVEENVKQIYEKFKYTEAELMRSEVRTTTTSPDL